MSLIKNKKGSVIIASLFFIEMALSFLGFSYDIARLMYVKTYTRSLASATAISMANECSYTFINDKEAISHIVYDERDINKKYPYYRKIDSGRKVANKSFANEIIDKNSPYKDKYINIETVMINPYYYTPSLIASNIDYYSSHSSPINNSRFIKGKDGKNGEIEIVIATSFKPFFFQKLAPKYVAIGSATAQPIHAYKPNNLQIIDWQLIRSIDNNADLMIE